MSKFNTAKSVGVKLAERSDVIKNHEDGLAFKATAEYELYLSCVSSFVEKIAYEKKNDYIDRVRKLCQQVSQEFILKLANYTRNEMNLRSISVLLFAEAASKHSVGQGNKAMLVEYAGKVIKRADEINEVLAYWINVVNGGSKKKMPSALKAAIGAAMNNFNEYSFAKYNRAGDVKFKDVLKMTHPKPKTSDQSALFKKILSDSLETPNTWEVIISTKGSNTENWNQASENMGLMALIRNIRNFEKHKADKAIKKTIQQLNNPDVVLKSRILPFRFYSAWKYASSNKLKDALVSALKTSVSNVVPMNKSVAVFSDTSGSMGVPVSGKSEVTCKDIACLMGAIASAYSGSEEYVSAAFATEVAEVDVSKHDSPISNMRKIDAANTNGWGTDAWKVFPFLDAKGFNPEVIFIFSDMQCYDSRYSYYSNYSLAELWIKYKRKNPNAILISVDLSSHGSLQFPQDSKDVLLMGGFSERIFDLVNMYSNGKNAVEYIKENF